jgi:hypothetical protein
LNVYGKVRSAMKRFALTAALALTVVQVAQANNNPGAFVKSIINQELAGQFDRTYATLYPAQKKLVSESRFMACYEQLFNAVSGATISDFKTTDVYASTITVPGTKVRTKTTAVSVRYTIHLGSESTPDAFTAHLAVVNGRYRWMMSAARFAQVKSNNCS